MCISIILVNANPVYLANINGTLKLCFHKLLCTYIMLNFLLQDFQDRTTILENEVHQRGHLCVFLPKFHCELNPIEHV